MRLRNWECLFIYEASTRHLVTRNLLKNEGGMNKFIHFAQQAPKVDAILIGHAYIKIAISGDRPLPIWSR